MSQEEPYLHKEEAKQIGKTASKQVAQSVTSFERIRKELKRINADGSSGVVPPIYEDILTDDMYYDEIVYIQQIVNKYHEHDYELHIHEINEDLIALSAGVVRLSTLVGYSKGVSTSAENDRKFVLAKMHIQVRDIAEKLGLKISDSAATSMSRAESSEYQQAASYASTAHEILQSLYYAASAFIRVLESAANRMNQERYHEKHA